MTEKEKMLRHMLYDANYDEELFRERIAAKELIREDFRITAEHGQWFERGGVQMTAIYHPSALLRDVTKRPETFEDLKSIQARIRAVCTRTDI